MIEAQPLPALRQYEENAHHMAPNATNRMRETPSEVQNSSNLDYLGFDEIVGPSIALETSSGSLPRIDDNLRIQ